MSYSLSRATLCGRELVMTSIVLGFVTGYATDIIVTWGGA